MHFRVYVRNRNENWRHDMTTMYRGVRVNPEQQANDKSVEQPGVYRGVPRPSTVEKSPEMKSGSYRGVRWGS